MSQTPAPNTQPQLRPEAILSQQIFAFSSTMVILAADELNLFVTLKDTGPATVDELAAAMKLEHHDALRRLLNACVSFGLVARDSADKYALTEVSARHLIPGDLGYMGGFFNHIRQDLLGLWLNLADAVRENRPQWHKLPHYSEKGVFETIYSSEEGVRAFMESMFSGSYGPSLEFAERFDFSPFKHICDVGGATGPFMAAVLPRFPEVKGTIYDLQPVEKFARETMEKHGLGDRVDFHAGDFFKDPLPTGPDMFVLGHILHDWDKDQGTAILKKIYDALPEGGAVLVAEMLFNDDHVSPPFTMFMDINMLCATTGRERSAAEYEAWLKEIGFARTAHVVCSNPKSIVVGYK